MTKSRKAVAVVLALMAGIGLACAETLEELQPFPCAKDGTCPAGFSCLKDGKCREGAARDQACRPPLVACAEGDCIGGICLLHCRTDGTGICDPGRVCSYPPPGESQLLAYCVADCRTTGCPAGLACETIYNDVKGCVSLASKVSLDQPCGTAEDCQTRYPNPTFLPITCSRGTCVPFCSATPPITCGDPARACLIADPILESGCLLDCSAGQPCPEGLACRDTPSPTGDAGARSCTANPRDGGGSGGGTGGGR